MRLRKQGTRVQVTGSTGGYKGLGTYIGKRDIEVYVEPVQGLPIIHKPDGSNFTRQERQELVKEHKEVFVLRNVQMIQLDDGNLVIASTVSCEPPTTIPVTITKSDDALTV